MDIRSSRTTSMKWSASWYRKWCKQEQVIPQAEQSNLQRVIKIFLEALFRPR